MTAMLPEPPEGDGYSDDVSRIIERGVAGGGVIPSYVEWRDDAFLTSPEAKVALEDLIHMRRSDGQARAIMRLVTLPVRLALQQAKWVAPPEGDADEEVDFANLMWTLPPALGGMTVTWPQLIDLILLSVSDGMAPFELVSHIPKIGPLKGKTALKKMAYRDPRTVTILQDRHGGYAGFRQIAVAPDGDLVDVSLSPKKTCLFTANGHENPFYGVSHFEAAYPHYESKLKWYYISEMAGQFSAVPGRMGTVPRGGRAEDVIAFTNALKSFYFNTSMVMKEGYEVTPFNPSTGFNFMQFIDHHNMMMAKSVLASFFESDQRTVLVENSTNDASADLFLLAMETIADEIAATISNHVMPKYIAKNFPDSTKYPVLKPGPLSDNVRRQISSMFEKVVVSGILNSTPEFVRELEKNVAKELGLDIDYADIEAREEEAAIQQAEQAELLAAQAQQQTLDQERAAEGGVPNSPTPTSGAASGTGGATRTDPGQQGQVPPEANNGMSLTDVELTASDIEYAQAVDMLAQAAQRLFMETPLENHRVDEGVFDD